MAQRIPLAAIEPDTVIGRMVGLIAHRQPLPPATGFVLRRCRAVHTCWMAYSIDLLFLDQAGSVVEVRRCARPWRFYRASNDRAVTVVELTAGESGRLGIGIGSQVELTAL